MNKHFSPLESHGVLVEIQEAGRDELENNQGCRTCPVPRGAGCKRRRVRAVGRRGQGPRGSGTCTVWCCSPA